MRRIIFGLVMLWAALFGAWQASAQFNGCPAGFCNPPAVSSGTTDLIVMAPCSKPLAAVPLSRPLRTHQDTFK